MGAQAITREGKRKRPNVRSTLRRVRRGLRISAVLTLLALVFADSFVRTAEEATGVEYAWVHLIPA